MGNICCKKKSTAKSGTYSASNRRKILTGTSRLEMANLCSNNQNNLELYLNDVYEKECVFKGSQEEVEFIQTGIETLVQGIVDDVLDIFPTELIKILNEDECIKSNIKEYFKESLIDIHFPIKELGSGFEDLTDIKPIKSDIIKVGSFYEGAKNNFPSEFDFIFLLASGRELDLFARFGMGWEMSVLNICDVILNTFNIWLNCKGSLHYSSQDGSREIYLKIPETGIDRHGPAYTLQFFYKDELAKERAIHVDLVPAIKIIPSNKPDWYIQHVNEKVKPKSFKDEILSAEGWLNVRGLISFTETEASFIKNILSQHHVKVYRILKFLINRHGDDTIMLKCGLFRPKSYSSYMIKTMMIYHHDECRNSDTTDMGPCVLQVLEEMCKYKSGDFPVFSSTKCTGPYLVDYIQSMIGTLESMQTSTQRYSYEENKMKSVIMQYIEKEETVSFQMKNLLIFPL